MMREIAPVLMGTSDAIRHLRQAVAVASTSNAKVLITGDTGTGKEVVAQLVHAQSARARRTLIALNCAGIPETLLESELFGHERGSFTGAETSSEGLLAKADGGTVLLDEVGETSLRMQAMLLRFLDSGEIQRVGGRSKTCVDVRLIAATNRDLAKSVAAKEFRLDLFYRLNVLHLRTTALCQRREDIPVLLTHFLGVCSRSYEYPVPTLTAGALDALTQYEWPGNVRELRNAAERMVVRRAERALDARDVLREIMPRREVAAHPTGPDASRAAELYRRLTDGREFFSSVVQEPYTDHDLTRDDIRSLVSRGLHETQGSYKHLVRLFNMDEGAYKWMVNFVRRDNRRQRAIDTRTTAAVARVA
jgi:DNA-binding NtrC family response regulator